MNLLLKEDASMKNKYGYLFNENMTELQANTVLFENAKNLNDEEKKELLEAWSKNNGLITKRELKEHGDNIVFTQSIM